MLNKQPTSCEAQLAATQIGREIVWGGIIRGKKCSVGENCTGGNVLWKMSGGQTVPHQPFFVSKTR